VLGIDIQGLGLVRAIENNTVEGGTHVWRGDGEALRKRKSLETVVREKSKEKIKCVLLLLFGGSLRGVARTDEIVNARDARICASTIAAQIWGQGRGRSVLSITRIATSDWNGAREGNCV
jgi:argonaute-like protein implicated in RNA metabolism and viral defense